MTTTRHLLLCMPEHGLARLELERLGGTAGQYLRCLNTTGRWAVNGQVHAPLLVWPIEAEQLAQAAAAAAGVARKRKVEVIERGYGGSSPPGWATVEPYTEKHAEALAGPLDFSAALQKKRQAQAEKLAIYVEAISRVVKVAGPEIPHRHPLWWT